VKRETKSHSLKLIKQATKRKKRITASRTETINDSIGIGVGGLVKWSVVALDDGGFVGWSGINDIMTKCVFKTFGQWSTFNIGCQLF